MIGLTPDEIPWIRRLVALLRHPDPTIPELAREALLYLARTSQKTGAPAPASAKLPKSPMVNCRE